MSSGSANLHPLALTTPNLCGVGELVMVAEIAEIYGVSRQAVDLWSKQPGFPEPIASLKAGRIWRTADVIEWAEARGRVSPQVGKPPS